MAMFSLVIREGCLSHRMFASASWPGSDPNGEGRLQVDMARGREDSLSEITESISFDDL